MTTSQTKVCLLITSVLLSLTALGACRTAHCQERDFNAYLENVRNYLTRVYSSDEQALAYREVYRGGVAQWLMRMNRRNILL